SRGRIDFGVGIGWLREEFEALDMDFDDRAERCRESIGAMRSLWTDALSSHDGALIRFPELRMFPKPVQKPHPPIVFGGDSDAALRRTADLGQGWYGFNQAPDAAAERVARLSGMLERRGRRRDDVEVSICPYLQPGLRGPEALHAYAEAGVDQVIHVAAGPDPASVRAEIERLASELLGVAGEIERRRRRAHVDV
ncbi:LLM class flavin-dependent oxidoreductase, partial [bacterium]|nr:LLM class flavin-dependent oxidoreductase [bacterium]